MVDLKLALNKRGWISCKFCIPTRPDGFDLYKIKRCLFDGSSYTALAKAMGLSYHEMNSLLHSLRIDQRKYLKRYRGLKLLLIARTIRAKAVNDIAQHLNLCHQGIRGRISDYGIYRQIKNMFRRNRNGLTAAPGIMVGLVDGRKVLYYSNNMNNYRHSALKHIKEVKVLKVCSGIFSEELKLECFKERFKNPEYLIYGETEDHFPGIAYHPTSKSWQAKYTGIGLGYYKDIKDAVTAVRDFVCEGKITKRRIVTDIPVEQLQDLINEGHTVNEMAAILNIQPAALYAKIQRAGLQVQCKRPKVDEDKLKELCALGLSHKVIAEKLGIAKSTVKRYIKKYSIIKILKRRIA
jgi:predicted transcriptional regulator